MITRAPQTERSYDTLDILLFVWRAGMILFAGVIGVYGYLTVAAAETSKCAGLPWIAGYWAGGVFKLSLLPLTGILAIAWALVHYRRARIIELLSAAYYRRIVLSLGPIRLTAGMLLLSGTLAGPILFAGPTELLVRRYHAIADYCQTASSRPKIWQVAMDRGLRARSLTDGTRPRPSQPRHESSRLGSQYHRA
jgi:hypothetical protein